MAKIKMRLEDILMEFSIDALKKKSNGQKKIPINDARLSIVNVRLNKDLADDILKELTRRKKIQKDQQFIKLF